MMTLTEAVRIAADASGYSAESATSAVYFGQVFVDGMLGAYANDKHPHGQPFPGLTRCEAHWSVSFRPSMYGKDDVGCFRYRVFADGTCEYEPSPNGACDLGAPEPSGSPMWTRAWWREGGAEIGELLCQAPARLWKVLQTSVG